MSSGTQLARVTDRSPLLLPLTAAATTDTNVPSKLSTVVKIRPTLVHFLVDGRVWVRKRLTLCNLYTSNCVYLRALLYSFSALSGPKYQSQTSPTLVPTSLMALVVIDF